MVFVQLLLSLLFASAAFSQSTSGNLFGTVLDPSGAPIPGAALTAVETSTGIVTRSTTNATGDFLFQALPIGTYRVEAEQPGFKKFVQTGIRVDLNSNVKVEIKLEVGAVSDAVEVSADSAVVETRDVQIGGLVENRRVNDLPLNGRNVYDLASILPGVTTSRTPTIQDNDGNTLNVNGNRARTSTFLLDGAFNNDLWRNTGNAAPNPEAVEQFRILTSNFSAEFGRSPGAVVNVVTKAGTNDFHGSAFEYFRNDKLNARPFFQPTVPALRQNQFGFSIGGPVLIPKLYNGRNRTFFFFSYQNLLYRTNAFTNSALPPSAAERRGDFSAAPAAQRPVDPLTNQPFPNGQIPLSRFDPVAVAIVDRFVPLPNTPDGRLELSASRRNNEPQYIGRGDHQVSPSHRVYGSTFLVRGSGYDPFASSTQVAEYGVNETIFTQNNVVGNHDWIVSPSALNQLRYSFTNRKSQLLSQVRDSWPEFGSRVTLGSAPQRPPQLFITGRWQMGTFGESTFDQRAHNLSNTFSLSRGSHNFKAGFWALWARFIESGNWLGSGQVRFQPQFTRNVLADFYLGRAASFRQNNGNDRDFRSDSYHFFLQDDWRVTRRLTLNLGLRYELNLPFVSHRDELVGFRFGTPSRIFPSAPLGLQFPGDPGVPRGVMPTDKNDWAPRVGLAYDLFGNGKTALRAGYGIYYSVGFANWTSNMQGQPWLIDYTVFGTPSLVDPYSTNAGGSPFPFTFNPAQPRFALPVTVSALSNDFRNPYIQQFSLSLEQQIGRTTSVSAAYVGNTARKLSYMRDYNAPVFGTGATAGNVNQRRPYQPGTYAAIGIIDSGSNSNYNALQLTFNRRFAQGITLLANYTWSKAIDESSPDITGPSAITLVDNISRRIERGPANFDVRHVFNVSWVWDLPRLQQQAALLRHTLGGWQLNGILRLQSGSPVNITTGRDTNLDGNANDRPDLVGDSQWGAGNSRSEKIARYFNPAAFAAAAPGRIGTLGRNTFYGPADRVFNLSLFKSFSLFENHRLQIRAEAFNFPNWVVLGNPTANLNSPNAGRILSSGAARQVQLALKYLF